MSHFEEQTRDATIAHRAARAVERRAPLAGDDDTTAYRLVNSAGDGLPGVTVDHYAGVLVVNLYDERASPDALLAALSALPDTRAIYVKRRPRTAARLSAEETAALAPDTPAWGQRVDEVAAREHGLSYLIRPGAGLSAGLFLDMRDTRARVRALARGRAVLNLFAYTCAFGVAAAAGGAARVLNIDAARPALAWGQENYALNGLAADPYDFVYGDAFDWLARLARRAAQGGPTFDLVIADPPSYSTVKSRRFTASRDYADLAAACARVAAPDGHLLLCANEARLPRHAFQQDCLRGVTAAGRTARVQSYDGASALDFPTPPGDEGHLKVLLLRLNAP